MRFINYLSFLSTFITQKKLIYVHYGLTYRCNLRCRMCGIWRLADNTGELTLDQIKIVADILKSLGVIAISLGGGEPLLKEDLREIIEIFIQRGFMVRLLTNGTLIKEDILRDFVDLGLREISISLDTLSAEKQSYICNQEDMWDRIINSMILISKLFPKRGSLLLVNTTVSRLNLEELPSLARFVGKLGYYISYIPLEPIFVGHYGFHSYDYPLEFKINTGDYKVVDKIYGELIKMKRKKSNIFNSTLFLEKSRQFLKSAQKNWQCDAGKLYFSLSPQGDFSICHHFQSERRLNYNIGDYLKSKAFQFRRQKLIDECLGCMRPCWAEISHMVKDWKSFWEMAKIEISTWQRRKFDLHQAQIQRKI